MGKKKRRPGKRNRERKSRHPVLEMRWGWNGREQLLAKTAANGTVSYVIYDVDRVDKVGREHAANWMREHFLPDLTHDQCYEFLWKNGGRSGG